MHIRLDSNDIENLNRSGGIVEIVFTGYATSPSGDNLIYKGTLLLKDCKIYVKEVEKYLKENPHSDCG
jgi:hypothetical protein